MLLRKSDDACSWLYTSSECNKNKCPTGVATQSPDLYKGLDVNDKYVRVANYHQGHSESVAEILCAAGISDLSRLSRKHIWRRISFNEIKNYEELFPYPETFFKISLLKKEKD